MSNSTIESTLVNGQNAINRTVSDLKEGVANTTATYAKMSGDAATITAAVRGASQGWMAAFSQAFQIYMTESQDLARQMVQNNQTAMNEAMTNMRALATAKSVKEGLQLQANIARTTAVWSVNESARLTHAGIEMAEKVYAPIASQTYQAADKIGQFKA